MQMVHMHNWHSALPSTQPSMALMKAPAQGKSLPSWADTPCPQDYAHNEGPPHFIAFADVTDPLSHMHRARYKLNGPHHTELRPMGTVLPTDPHGPLPKSQATATLRALPYNGLIHLPPYPTDSIG